MTRTTKFVIAGALAFILMASIAAAGLVASVASAQAPTGTPTAQTFSLAQAFWQNLANRLGISIDRLQQGVKDASKDTVAQAQKDGTITQSQADSLNQRIDGWQPGQPLPFVSGRGFGRGMGHGFGLFGGQAVLDAAAKTLGMTTTDLQNELQSGKSLADVAKEKNVDVNTLKQAIVNAAKAQVDQAQQAGKLTQAQADQIKQRIDQMAQNWDLSQPFFHGFFGHERGNRGNGAPGQAPIPTAPANGV